MVVDSNLETKDCITMVAEKLALTSNEDFSGFLLYEAYDDGNAINTQLISFSP